MNEVEARTLYRAVCEKYNVEPSDVTEERWVNSLDRDELTTMAEALAKWYRRRPTSMPSIADLRSEGERTYQDPSRVRAIARAAYEAECARLGRPPSALLAPHTQAPRS